MPTLGIHLIWTTYGTWLPGDDRGHWSALFDMYGLVQQRRGQLNLPDDTTRRRSVEAMTEPAKWLDEDEQQLVAAEMANHVGDSPVAWAAAVEPNHVHLLIGNLNEDIAKFAGRVKGRKSSVVGKWPRNQARRRTWTADYWKVFLFDVEALVIVKQYIENHNLRRGLPAAPYPWVRPLDI